MEFSLHSLGLVTSSWVRGENMERWVEGGRGGLVQGGGRAPSLVEARVVEVRVVEVANMLVEEGNTGRRGMGETGAGGGGSSTISSRSSSSNILSCRLLSETKLQVYPQHYLANEQHFPATSQLSTPDICANCSDGALLPRHWEILEGASAQGILKLWPKVHFQN